MQIVNVAKYTGDGSAHPFSATSVSAKWVQFVVETLASISAPARTGGPLVSSTLGAPLFQAGASQFYPQDTTDMFVRYDLSELHYYLAFGDTASVTYGI